MPYPHLQWQHTLHVHPSKIILAAADFALASFNLSMIAHCDVQMGQAVKASHTNENTKDDAALVNIIDGAGVGKTRILEEVQACADMPSWHSLPKLELGTETKQVSCWAALLMSLTQRMQTVRNAAVWLSM